MVITCRATIRRATNLGAPAGYMHETALIYRLAKDGISEIENDPTLLRTGHVPSFLRAQAAAERAGLDACSPVADPAGA